MRCELLSELGSFPVFGLVRVSGLVVHFLRIKCLWICRKVNKGLECRINWITIIPLLKKMVDSRFCRVRDIPVGLQSSSSPR
jgi:hypothetical protein